MSDATDWEKGISPYGIPHTKVNAFDEHWDNINLITSIAPRGSAEYNHVFLRWVADGCPELTLAYVTRVTEDEQAPKVDLMLRTQEEVMNKAKQDPQNYDSLGPKNNHLLPTLTPDQKEKINRRINILGHIEALMARNTELLRYIQVNEERIKNLQNEFDKLNENTPIRLQMHIPPKAG